MYVLYLRATVRAGRHIILHLIVEDTEKSVSDAYSTAIVHFISLQWERGKNAHVSAIPFVCSIYW